MCPFEEIFSSELDKALNNLVEFGANSALCIRLNYELSQGSLQPKWLCDFMKSMLSKCILCFITVYYININCVGCILIHLGASNDSFFWKSVAVSNCTSQTYFRNKIPPHSLKSWGQTKPIFLYWFGKTYKLVIKSRGLLWPIYTCMWGTYCSQTQGMKVMGLKSVNLEHLLPVADTPMTSPKSHIETTATGCGPVHGNATENV